MPNASRIAVLTVPNDHSWALINALTERFGPVHVLAEERQSYWSLIRQRARRVGGITVMGQIGFVLLQKAIDHFQRARTADIIRETALDVRPNPACPIYRIGSVNAETCRETLARIDPEVVVVSGTRLIGRATREAIQVPLLNVHMGWNPAYRGQAGGYWALAAGDLQRAGVTIHLIDGGVDTGPMLYRERFTPSRNDTFSTYFYRQSAIARPILVCAVEDALSGRLSPLSPTGEESRMFVHPTLWRYVWTGITRGVW